jgi:bacterioferritin-associated ferredoxin
MFVCVCKGIKESDVRALGQAGITCPKALASSLGIDDKDNCCGRCLNNIDDFVNMATDELMKVRSSVQA